MQTRIPLYTQYPSLGTGVVVRSLMKWDQIYVNGMFASRVCGCKKQLDLYKERETTVYLLNKKKYE